MRTDRQDEADSRISKFFEKRLEMAREFWRKRAWTGFTWLWTGADGGPVGNKGSGSIYAGNFFTSCGTVSF